MNTLRTVLSAVIALALLSGCATKETDESAAPLVRVRIEDAIPLKEAAKSISGIPLSDSDAEHFPGDISRLVWKRDSIFIIDGFKDRGLYLYNSDGKLVNSYTDKGNGPEEFLGMGDIFVTPSEIILLDTHLSNRIYLDRNLRFLRKEPTEWMAEHFYAVGNDSFWYDRGNVVGVDKNRGKLIYTSADERNVVLSVPEELENITVASFNGFVPVRGDTILYLPPAEPRLYKCYDSKAEEFCRFDFGSRWPDYENMDPAKVFEFIQTVKGTGKVYSPNLLSDGSTFALSFRCDKNRYILLFGYDDLSSTRLLKIDAEDVESMGELVAVCDGELVFGQPGKLIRIGV